MKSAFNGFRLIDFEELLKGYKIYVETFDDGEIDWSRQRDLIERMERVLNKDYVAVDEPQQIVSGDMHCKGWEEEE